MAVSLALLCPSLSPLSGTIKPTLTFNQRSAFTFRLSGKKLLCPASTRISNFPQVVLREQEGGDDNGTRIWSRTINSVYGADRGYVDEEDDSDDEEEDRSLDLLIQFVQNVFRKISKRVKKAVRSVLPLSIPSELVGFSVNGVLILAFLWILKAFLEVICTLGSVVFVSILLIRGVWTALIFLQDARNHKLNDILDDDQRRWNNAQPVS